MCVSVCVCVCVRAYVCGCVHTRVPACMYVFGCQWKVYYLPSFTSPLLGITSHMATSTLNNHPLHIHSTSGRSMPSLPSSLIPRPSSFIPHPSSLVPRPSSLVPRPSSLVPRPSSLIPHPSSLIPHPSSLIPHPSSLIPHPSSLIPPIHSPRVTSSQGSPKPGSDATSSGRHFRSSAAPRATRTD